MLDRELQRADPRAWTGSSHRGMVASAHYLATEAGQEILADGGNAFDAAVATSLALSVVESAGSGLGGMAILAATRAGSPPFVLAGPCTAPRAATPESIAASSRYSGHRAVAVPGYPAVLEALCRQYTTRPLLRLAEPAIRLASRGFPCTKLQSALIERYRPKLRRYSAGEVFLTHEGRAPTPGSVVSQPALARALEHLARVGWRDFYEGEVARHLASDAEANEGFLTLGDLAAYPRVMPVAPRCASFRDFCVHTAAAPAGGAALLHMLGIFSGLAQDDFDPDTPAGIELMVRVIRRTRIDRRREHRGRAFAPIGTVEAATRAIDELGGEGETSHLSVLDADGNAVALTQSIERSFGAKVVAKDLGFLLNGYLKTFNISRPNHPYFVAPGRAARSNAAPTVVTRDNRATIVVGSTGSERMVSSIFGVLVRLWSSQEPFKAVHAPRLHATPRGEILLELTRFPPDTRRRLEHAGFTIRELDPYSFLVGGLQLVVRESDGTLTGVADPRRDGSAAGPETALGHFSEAMRTEPVR